MQVTFDIPDALLDQIAACKDPSRAALEAVAVEGYRTERLSENEVRVMLGFATRMQVHDILKEHGAFLHYRMEELQQDITASDMLHRQRALLAASLK